MESFVQKLAKKKESTITILPVLKVQERDHGATCNCGEEGCGGAEDSCCGG